MADAPQSPTPDQALQDAILQQSIADQQAAETQGQPGAPPPAPATATPAVDPQSGFDPSQTDPMVSEQFNPTGTQQAGQRAQHIMDLGSAAVEGANKAIFETHDFLFGPTPEDQKSSYRKAAEGEFNRAADNTPAAGLVGGISQFATGMVGLGKLTEGMKLLPWVGRTMEAGYDALKGTILGEAGTHAVAAEAKAAIVAATAFDPHQQRLSDLLTQYPIFNNTVTRYLASSPEDTDAEGRIKNVLEGIGITAATGALFLGTARLYKALASGDREAIKGATEDVLKAQQKAADNADSVQQPAAAPDTSVADHSAATGDASAQPSPAGTLPAGQEGSVPAPQPGAVPPVAKPRYSVSWGPDGQPIYTPKQFLDAAEGKSTAGDLTASPEGPNSPAATNGGGGDGAPANSVVPNSSGSSAPTDGLPGGPSQAGGPGVVPGAGAGDNVGGSASPASGGNSGRPGGGGALDQSAVRDPGSPMAPPGAGPQGRVDVSAVPNATEGLAQEGITGPAKKPKFPQMSDEQATGLLNKLNGDLDALDERDYDLAGAIAEGHKFAVTPDTLPYNRMSGPSDFQAFMGRMVEARTKELSAIKGGAVLSDAKVLSRIQTWSRAYNIDPAKVLGTLQQAGKGAADSVALMDVGYGITNAVGKDAFATAQRLVMGASQNTAADTDLLKMQLAIVEQALGSAGSIVSNAGRTLRRASPTFALSPKDIAALRSLDGDTLATLVANAGGDLRKLQLIAKPTLWRQISDPVNFLYTNNLLWGWKTHVVNATSNAYMALSRPAERILGSLTMGNEGASIRQQAYKQYYYMGSSLVDSFRAAVEAFKVGDSKIAPHNTELYRTAGTDQGGVPGWKPDESVANTGFNALAAAKNVLGLPTRFLGASDEMMKVITYRSYVTANAAMDAEQIISQQGLQGGEAMKFHRDFINKRLAEAFGDRGYATDMNAKREAQVATFSQDLLPNTIGKGVQSFVNSVPAARIILPFVKTPTNIIRYSWKLTPGLNMAQSEFRQAFLGKLGDTPEIQAMNMAQARGQMALGTAFMGAAAYLTLNGKITGAGPSDPAARKALLATGWQPYSIRTVNADGSVSYDSYAGRLDPIAMPFGIVADLITAAQHPEADPSWGSAAAALGIALVKNISNRTYLTGLSQAIDAITDPDRSFEKTAGNVAANFIPMSSMLRQVNPDPYMRDARSVVDKLLATVPGFSTSLPPRRDNWGDPLTVHRTFSTMTDGLVDQEMERLTMDTEDGKSIAGLTPTKNGADLRTVTMADGRNAWDRYQELGGHLPGAPSLKSLVAKVMQTPAYLKAPDGTSGLKGTKLYLLGTVINPYHDKALKVLQQDPNVRSALYAANEKVRAAYAAQQRDPQGAIPQKQQLDRILQGVGLPGVSTGPVTPSQ